MKNLPKQRPRRNGAGNNARVIKVLGRAPAVVCTHCRGTRAVKTLTCTMWRKRLYPPALAANRSMFRVSRVWAMTPRPRQWSVSNAGEPDG